MIVPAVCHHVKKGDMPVDIKTVAEHKQVMMFEKIEWQCHFH